MKHNFDKPTQVRFREENGDIGYGIAFNDYIICACCGTVFSLTDEDDGVKIEDVYKNWIGFSDEIGEE